MAKIGDIETSLGKFPINCNSSGNFSVKIPDFLLPYVSSVEVDGKPFKLAYDKNQNELIQHKNLDVVRHVFNRLIAIQSEKDDRYRLVVMYNAGTGDAGPFNHTMFDCSHTRGVQLRFAAAVLIEHTYTNKHTGELIGCPTYFTRERLEDSNIRHSMSGFRKFYEALEAGELPDIPPAGRALNGYGYQITEHNNTPRNSSYKQSTGSAVIIDYDEDVVASLCQIANHLTKVGQLFKVLFNSEGSPLPLIDMIKLSNSNLLLGVEPEGDSE